jgi:hypothetical protein
MRKAQEKDSKSHEFILDMCFFDKNALPVLPIQRQYDFEFVRAHFRTRYLL